MRTTLELDDELMGALMAHCPDKSKTKAVETAIAEFLRRDAAAGMRRLRGTISFADSEHWRKSRRLEAQRQRPA
jgi:predicted transcriptional regulator